METFVIEYVSCEDNFRWMTIEAENAYEAEILALDGTDVGGDGIAKISDVYRGEGLHDGY
jgi:hypothetical protein